MSKYQLPSEMNDASASSNASLLPQGSRSLGLKQRGQPQRPNAILVVGGTGVGKSSFTATVSGKEVGVGHALRSFTASCQAVDLPLDSKRSVQLVDTPGFNDTTRSDLDVLAAIAGWIQTNKAQIVGIIFMHRINEKRFTGKDRMTFEILKAMCGPHFLSHVVLCTTMWNQLPRENAKEAEMRESELVGSEQFWNPLLARGAKYKRFMGDRVSALEIVNAVLDYPASSKMEMQLELSDPKCDVEDTAAGQIITAEIRRKEEKLRQERLEEEEEERDLREKLKAEQDALRYEQDDRRRGNGFAGFHQAEKRGPKVPRERKRSRDMRNIVEIVPNARDDRERREARSSAADESSGSASQGRFGGFRVDFPYFGRTR